MQDAIKQLALVNRLHDEGFDIEIDDFGKGYSSLSLLKDINADVLKIDKEFLQETQNSKRSEDILGTVIDMSDRLAMRVITEGVETREQLEKMIELGCYMFQGYYFAKPMSLEEFESKWTEIGASFNEEKLA
jgi:EAL domain-containing protein (putative c-di-GMP-specific phosphodiesterase class I)